VQTLDRVEEGVDGDVVDLGQFGLELAAVGTIDVGEHHQLARAVALDGLQRVVERQRVPFHRLQLVQPRLRQVVAVLQVDHVAGNHVLRLAVDVNQLVVEIDLEQSAVRRFLHRGDVGPRELLGQRLADDGLIGLRGRSEHHGCGQRQGGEFHSILQKKTKNQDTASRTSAAFSGGR